MAAASTSMAAVTAVLAQRFHIVRSTTNCSVLPSLPAPLSSPAAFSSSFKLVSESRRTSVLQVRVTSSDETSSGDTGEILTNLKEKWDAVENKSTVIIYGAGAVVAVWLASALVNAVDSLPLLPKILELVGLGYTGWFVYRYLLFKASRQELAEDIESIKKKIAGTE